MPQNATVAVSARTWTQLTNADVSALRVQNINGYSITIMGTVGAVAPTTDAGAIVLAAAAMAEQPAVGAA